MSRQINTAPRPLEPMPRAIIVGASSGVGAALARELHQHGYVLAVLGRRLPELQHLANELNTERAGTVAAYTHDVHDWGGVAQLCPTICAQIGGLDLFVYCAGVMYPNNPATYATATDLEMLQTNLLGAVAWLNEVGPRMQSAGTGQIVGIGSIAGDRGRRGIPAYSASKAGLHTYLEGMRNRLARHGVTVTTIKLWQVQTAMLANADRVVQPSSPELAARLIWGAIRRKQQVVYVPGRWAAAGLVLQHLPSFIFRRLSL